MGGYAWAGGLAQEPQALSSLKRRLKIFRGELRPIAFVRFNQIIENQFGCSCIRHSPRQNQSLPKLLIRFLNPGFNDKLFNRHLLFHQPFLELRYFADCDRLRTVLADNARHLYHRR